MKRTTISLPDDLAGALDREAKRRSESASNVARRALSAYLGLDESSQPRPLPFANLGHSGESRLADDMEAVLAKEWGEQARDH